MSDGEMLYLTLVLGVFSCFIVAMVYGIVSSAQARKMRAGSEAARMSAESQLPRRTLPKAA